MRFKSLLTTRVFAASYFHQYFYRQIRSQKQCGRAQWGNISSELARTIIACGVEATARSRHNVGYHHYMLTFLSLHKFWWTPFKKLMWQSSIVLGSWIHHRQHPCRQNNEIPRKQRDMCTGYWVRLRVVYTENSAEAIVDASDAKS